MGQPTYANSTLPDNWVALRLTLEDYLALARQGFVAAEYREAGGRRLGPYYRLHWRREGRQQVRYLGSDPARAEAIRAALAELQQARHLELHLRRVVARAAACRRAGRRQLAPLLAERGLHLHGTAIRRSRKVQASARVERSCEASSYVSPYPWNTEEQNHEPD
jgi:hypothetical protein